MRTAKVFSRKPVKTYDLGGSFDDPNLPYSGLSMVPGALKMNPSSSFVNTTFAPKNPSLSATPGLSFKQSNLSTAPKGGMSAGVKSGIAMGAGMLGNAMGSSGKQLNSEFAAT